MLEPAFTNKVEQPLQLRDFDHARAAEGVERVVSKFAFADVAAHLASGVVGGEASEAHLFGLNESDACAEGVFLPNGSSDDFLEVHFDGTEEMLGQIRAVEADCLIRIGP